MVVLRTYRKTAFFLISLLLSVALCVFWGTSSANTKGQHSELKTSHERAPSDDFEDSEIIYLRFPRLPSHSHAHQDQSLHEVTSHARVFRWVAWGKPWVLHTWADSHFLSPTFLVREESANESWVSPPKPGDGCFVRGKLEGEEVSDVALNRCSGLRGVIRVGNSVYLIQPLEDQISDALSKIASNSDSLLTNNSNDNNSQSNYNNNINNNISTLKANYNNINKNNSNININKSDRTYSDRDDDSVVIIPHVLRFLSPFSPVFHPDDGGLIDRGPPGGTHDPPTQNAPNHRPGNITELGITGSAYLSPTADHRLPPHSDSSYFLEPLFRPKRFLFSKRHTIEVMVVVDDKMVDYHGNKMDQYVLTLMSMASLIFRESSLGNHVDIAVIEVVRPEGSPFLPKRGGARSHNELSSGISAEEMLKMFCKWQKQGLKSRGEHPQRYDTALLITRENICRNPYTQSCDTLGLAELGTMCSRHASCAIVQDNGLSAAFTIAHELGHLLNMPHDDDDKCSLFRGEDEKENKKVHMNVMSRMLDHNTLPWIWSNCSKHYLTEFLQTGHGKCMEDEPWSNKLKEDDVEVTLAGELFSATSQCQYVFGKTSNICPYMPKCKRLWCTTTMDEKEGCRTQHMPWADGTPCDRERWCLRGECELKNKDDLTKIHGEWGAWQPWSSCSRTCGVGVRRSERFCDAPKPQYGGHFCVGERIRYESCTLNDCPKGSLDFRSEQCKQFDGKNFDLPDIPEDVRWIPKYAGIPHEDGCKLFCQVYNSSFYYQLKEKVEDGTPCGPDSYNICVSGQCRLAGCDYVLNSTLKDDWCGVCNGDNSTCQMVSGTLEDVQNWGYSDVIVIPERAARIEIKQRAYHDRSSDDNYLSLVDMETGEYILNGNWVVTPFQKLVEFGGSLLQYTGSNRAIERINSTKPLHKKLLVQILSVGKLNPPFVEFSYSKSNQDTQDTIYYWHLGEWTECSRPCLGDRERTPLCLRGDTSARVADHLCSRDEKPLQLTESCSLSCSVRWLYTEWGQCALDANMKCVKRREVSGCVTSASTPVEVERCSSSEEQLVTAATCKRDECPVWMYSGWTPCLCSSNKYEGEKKRLYACYLRGRPVNEWECNGLTKPAENRLCPCWYAEDWMECKIEESSTVLELKRRIEQLSWKYSQNASLDARAFKGHIIQTTDFDKKYDHLYPNHYGYNSDSPSCPRGKKRRRVLCGPPTNLRPTKHCDTSHKPSEVSSCQIACTTTSTSTTSTTSESTTTPLVITTTTTTTPRPVVTTTSSRSVDGHNRPFMPEIPFRKKINSEEILAEKFTPINVKGRKHVGGKRRIQKGGSAERPSKNHINSITTNEIANALPNSGSYKVAIGSDKRGGSVFSSPRLKSKPLQQSPNTFDSGEEESNNLVKHRENIRDHMWQTGGWTKCSKECGTGQQRRQVVCGGSSSQCPRHLTPKDTRECNTHPCTEWTHGEWGSCHPRKRNPCRGTKYRRVLCRNLDGGEVDSTLCMAEDKPQSKASCYIPCIKSQKNRFRHKWKKGPWSSVKYNNGTLDNNHSNESIDQKYVDDDDDYNDDDGNDGNPQPYIVRQRPIINTSTPKFFNKVRLGSKLRSVVRGVLPKRRQIGRNRG